jgi:ABC-type uncharacterized transport system permease subunit
MFELVLMTVITAATPLVISAIGELIAERAGVLNLGVEGMMIVGASLGFAVAYQTGSTMLGALAGIFAGVVLSSLFALLAIGLAINQVASGLALTILGVGDSGLIPGLSDLPIVGRLVFGEDLFVYAGLAIVLACWYFLNRTRAGLTLRAIGDNHHSAHALGLPVRRVRVLATLFGGACAGLAGAYLSLAYTPFWSPGMTAGRGWIALALVVFASWKPLRVMLGAILFGGATVLQLHAQAASVGVPGQLLSATPYLATIVALMILSIGVRKNAAAPAALGQPFVATR